MDPCYDIILGDDWRRKHPVRGHLMYDGCKITVSRGGKQYSIPSDDSPGNAKSSDKSLPIDPERAFLSAARERRFARKGARLFMVQVRDS